MIRGIYIAIRKNFLLISVVKHWKRLCREVAGSPLHEAFKTRLNKHLGDMI